MEKILLIKEETLTNLANEIRDLSSSTGLLNTDEMLKKIQESKERTVQITIDPVQVPTSFYWGDGKRVYKVDLDCHELTTFRVPAYSLVYSSYPLFEEITTFPDPDENVVILTNNLIEVLDSDVYFRAADGAPISL